MTVLPKVMLNNGGLGLEKRTVSHSASCGVRLLQIANSPVSVLTYTWGFIMNGFARKAFLASWLVMSTAAGLLTLTTGCQVDVGGQTLPSPYYMKDDVQYFAPGPEFKLSREAAALQQAKAQQQAQATALGR
jgi:hypothetical protein